MRCYLALAALLLAFSLTQAQYEYLVPQRTINQQFEDVVEQLVEEPLSDVKARPSRYGNTCTTKANCCK